MTDQIVPLNEVQVPLTPPVPVDPWSYKTMDETDVETSGDFVLFEFPPLTQGLLELRCRWIITAPSGQAYKMYMQPLWGLDTWVPFVPCAVLSGNNAIQPGASLTGDNTLRMYAGVAATNVRLLLYGNTSQAPSDASVLVTWRYTVDDIIPPLPPS